MGYLIMIVLDPSAGFFFRIRLAKLIFRRISGLAAFLRKNEFRLKIRLAKKNPAENPAGHKIRLKIQL